ncbi:hypothetical protein CcCBS67573_g10132 [Chytriomyces confervae]|uniref:C1q domain-containing protein n=1 Tax=Chytriomyces confervae TaxID=246404 RepID=A0A507DF60_9FUNG|nr:hypothetical protein CcCBS67573_g10132 [Chytriomyces confervae]
MDVKAAPTETGLIIDSSEQEFDAANKDIDALFEWRQRPQLSTNSLLSNATSNIKTNNVDRLNTSRSIKTNSIYSAETVSAPLNAERSPIVIIGDHSATTASFGESPRRVPHVLHPRPYSRYVNPPESEPLSPSKITNVMASMADQTRAVQALKEAVKGVDAVKSDSDPSRESAHARSFSSQVRSRSAGPAPEYNAFMHRSQSPFNYLNSVYQTPFSANHTHTHDSYLSNSTLYAPPFQTNNLPLNNPLQQPTSISNTGFEISQPRNASVESNLFDKKMADIVSSAVQDAFNTNAHFNDKKSSSTAGSPQNTGYMDRRELDSMSETASTSSKPRNYAKRPSNSSSRKHGASIFHTHRNHSSHVRSASTTKRSNSNTPVNASTKYSHKLDPVETNVHISTLTRQLEILSSRLHDVEVRQSLDPELSTASLLQKRLRAFESKLDGIEGRILQAESREWMDRVDETSGKYIQQTALSNDIRTLKSQYNQLTQSTLPSLESRLQHDVHTIIDSQNDTHESQQTLTLTQTNLENLIRQHEIRIDSLEESVKLLQGRFDFQLVSLEQVRNTALKAASVKPAAEDEDLQNVIEAIVETRIDDAFKKAELDVLRKRVDGKVDTVVLEELVRHLATRDELKRMYESLQKSNSKRFEKREMSRENELASLKEQVLRELKRDVEVRVVNLKKEMKEWVNESGGFGEEGNKTGRNSKRNLGEAIMSTEFHEALDLMEHRWLEQLEQVSTVGRSVSKIPDSLVEELREDLMDQMQLLLQQHTNSDDSNPNGNVLRAQLSVLSRDFDEKLHLLCTDLTACKQAYQAAVRQPFYRCAQWHWNSGVLKLRTSVPWTVESINTDPDNFIWDCSHAAHVIRVQDPGLYEITFGFFDVQWRPSVSVVVNGESVFSAVNSPSYVVHHGSGVVVEDGKARKGTVTGLSLIDFLCLPAKSTISLHYHGGKKEMMGHAFLGLRRL